MGGRLSLLAADIAKNPRLKFFERFPKKLRIGPWSIGAKLYILVAVLLIVCFFNTVVEESRGYSYYPKPVPSASSSSSTATALDDKKFLFPIQVKIRATILGDAQQRDWWPTKEVAMTTKNSGSSSSGIIDDHDHYPSCLSIPLSDISHGNVTALAQYLHCQWNTVLCGPRALLLYGAFHTVGVLAYMIATIGPTPLVSFTMFSWSILTLRYCCGALLVAADYLLEASLKEAAGGGSLLDLSAPSPLLAHLVAGTSWLDTGLVVALDLREWLRFPVLAQNALTVTVWWIALVPAITLFLKPHQRKPFLAWNASFFLVNVHLLNLPLALADHWWVNPRLLSPLELWLGLVLSISYLLFYLSILDAIGLHFYIILSPRTNWCVVVYTALLGAYWGFWTYFNARMGGQLQLEG